MLRCGRLKQVIISEAFKIYACDVNAMLFAATADKVTAALQNPAASDMKLEDLEAHLNSLKQMFIEKQKMMDSLNPSA